MSSSFATLLLTASLSHVPAAQAVLPPAPRLRHALILCGHPGDAEHVKTFTEIVRKLSDGLTKTIGIPVERQHVVFGADKPKDLPNAVGPTTREAVMEAVAV